mmetsp:Transcript_5320/g.8221  ORF Transcript_5320/g.8221 Transcript_5320/m.8221 type:complete len:92 (+) Transcript_5320:198-473(+)
MIRQSQLENEELWQAGPADLATSGNRGLHLDYEDGNPLRTAMTQPLLQSLLPFWIAQKVREQRDPTVMMNFPEEMKSHSFSDLARRGSPAT